jgi:hypothetical protein
MHVRANQREYSTKKNSGMKSLLTIAVVALLYLGCSTSTAPKMEQNELQGQSAFWNDRTGTLSDTLFFSDGILGSESVGRIQIHYDASRVVRSIPDSMMAYPPGYTPLCFLSCGAAGWFTYSISQSKDTVAEGFRDTATQARFQPWLVGYFFRLG